MAAYFEKNLEQCIFDDKESPVMDNSTAMILLEILMNPASGHDRVDVSKTGTGIDGVKIFSCSQTLVTNKLVQNLTKNEMDMPDFSSVASSTTYPELANCSVVEDGNVLLIKRNNRYYFSVAVWMAQVENEGAYSVFYHNCPNYKRKTSRTTAIVST